MDVQKNNLTWRSNQLAVGGPFHLQRVDILIHIALDSALRKGFESSQAH